MKLTTHLHLVSSLEMGGAILQLYTHTHTHIHICIYIYIYIYIYINSRRGWEELYLNFFLFFPRKRIGESVIQFMAYLVTLPVAQATQCQ